MFLKSFQITALMLMGFSAAQAQQQPIYWSTTQPDCGSYKSLQLSNGNYVCEVYGIFPWFAAGAGWKTSIRTAAPASAPIAAFYSYYDTNGNAAALDANYVDGAGVTSGQNYFSFARRGPYLQPDRCTGIDFGLYPMPRCEHLLSGYDTIDVFRAPLPAMVTQHSHRLERAVGRGVV